MQKELSLKTAVNYLANRVANVSRSEIETFLTKNPAYLKLPSMEALLNKLVETQGWSLVQDDDSDESSEEENQVEKQLASCLTPSGLVLSQETLTIFAKKLGQIHEQMNIGAICIRWILLDVDQQQEVSHRLCDGLAAIIFHIASSIGIEKQSQSVVGGEQKLIEQFNNRTIILHGSYLFGPGNYSPADMDVIDTGTNSKTAPIIKITRETKEGNMTIGNRYSSIDIMVGIPLSLPVNETLVNKKLAELWNEVDNNLKIYLGDAQKEMDDGKRYRKLANIAIIVNYFASKLNIELVSGFIQNIKRANDSIVGNNPQNLAQLNEVFQKQCSTVYSLVKKALN